MRVPGRRFATIGAFLVAVPGTAAAADAYWNQLCTNGGWAFNSCASAWVTANGNAITLRIWNLGGLPRSNTYNNAGFTAVGLSNLGSGLAFMNLAASRVGGGAYNGWQLTSNITGPSSAGGVLINGVGDAIFSQRATSIPGNGSPAVTQWGGPGQFANGFVQFQFDAFTQTCTGQGANKVCTYLPATIDLTNAVLGLHVQSGPNGASTGYECSADGSTGPGLPYPCEPFSTVPEPATTALLATGLAALGLVQLRRLRRRT